MSAPVRVAGFVAAIAAVFGLAVLAGRAVGPEAGPVTHDMAATHGEGAGGSPTHGGPPSMGTTPAGLTFTQDGYSLRLREDRLQPGRRTVAFTVTGPDGRPVTDYDVRHDKRLHLIVVRRDATGFQHVHPALAADGTWTAEVTLDPGPWRVYADFAPAGGAATTLAADLLVPGGFRPAAPRPVVRTAAVDGYTVTLAGDLVAGDDSVLTPRVSHGGRDVTGELEPYLGALGHLVALRRGDLAYLHVHPERLDFHTAVPTSGAYELFLDFRHHGVVRTAAFTLTASAGASPSSGTEHDHDH